MSLKVHEIMGEADVADEAEFDDLFQSMAAQPQPVVVLVYSLDNIQSFKDIQVWKSKIEKRMDHYRNEDAKNVQTKVTLVWFRFVL